ncbi:MAG: DUF624 domain-containing protein [Lachnospiraceae bacterium]|nr:DUF624 domain-containing protein [Lachnospiraceae bacterium]
MKIFDLDSPLINFLNKVADLMWLNILTMICCIPIITAGASLTAMHYMALKIVRNEECYITRGFFKSFKENFKQATIIWLILLLVVVILVGDVYIIMKSGIEFHMVLRVVIMAAAVLVAFTATFVFPVLAKFENSVKGTIKNAFLMSILQFPKTITMIVLNILPAVLFIYFFQMIPVIFLFGFSLPAFLGAFLYNKFFQKLEEQLLVEAGENAEEVREEEEERIFKDELDESLVTKENV